MMTAESLDRTKSPVITSKGMSISQLCFILANTCLKVSKRVDKLASKIILTDTPEASRGG